MLAASLLFCDFLFVYIYSLYICKMHLFFERTQLQFLCLDFEFVVSQGRPYLCAY